MQLPRVRTHDHQQPRDKRRAGGVVSKHKNLRVDLRGRVRREPGVLPRVVRRTWSWQKLLRICVVPVLTFVPASRVLLRSVQYGLGVLLNKLPLLSLCGFVDLIGRVGRRFLGVRLVIHWAGDRCHVPGRVPVAIGVAFDDDVIIPSVTLAGVHGPSVIVASGTLIPARVGPCTTCRNLPTPFGLFCLLFVQL